MTARINFTVFHASSSESGHSEKELEIRNNYAVSTNGSDTEDNASTPKPKGSNGKGWQSARFCEYPQYLVLRLTDNIYTISQIQILSHQSKIASKIEIWVAEDTNQSHDSKTYDSLNWNRLGYLSLAKNERSNWKARELKSVYIKTNANYIKFAMHESHINTINLFNQVGIVALSILGTKFKALTAAAPDAQLAKYNESQLQIPSLPASLPPINHDTESVASLSSRRSNDLSMFDAQTCEQILELQKQKTLAVQKEDYDEAKRCKLLIQRLKTNANKLKTLTKQKKEAVENEDYDLAKQLKLAIEQLRTMSIDDNNPNHMQQQQQQRQSWPMQQPQQPMQPQQFRNSMPMTNMYQHQQQQQQPHLQANIAPPQQQNQANMYQQNSNIAHHQNADTMPFNNATPAAPQYMNANPNPNMNVNTYANNMPINQSNANVHMTPTHVQPHQPQQFPSHNANRSAERQIRPMNSTNYSAVDESNVDPFGVSKCNSAGASEHNSPKQISFSKKMRAQKRPFQNMNPNPNSNTKNFKNNTYPKPNSNANANFSNNSNSTTTNFQAQGKNVSHNNKPKDKSDEPPELKGSVRKACESMIEMFGEWTLRYLYSPNWAHRDKGLQQVITFLEKKQHPHTREVFKLAAKIIYKSFQDRVAKIFFRGVDTLNKLVELYADSMKPDDLSKFCHQLIMSLVNVLGHSNTRMVDSSGSMIITLAHTNQVLLHSIFSSLCKPMRKALPKHLKGRGVVVIELIQQFDIPPTIDLQQLFQLIKPNLLHKDGDVRNIGVQLCVLVYQRQGNKIVPYVDDMNDFMKETLNGAFYEVTGQMNVLERDPKSQKEQSRPSKAMRASRTGSNNRSQKRNSRNQRNASNRRNNRRGGRSKKRPVRGSGYGQSRQRGGGGGGSGGMQNGDSQYGTQGQYDNRNEDHQSQHQQQQQQQYNQERFNNENVSSNGQIEEDAEDQCNFCGLKDPAFLENEETLDLHYWQACPMLTSCKLCEQVIEIPTLFEHMLTECESGVKHVLCKRCQVPYTIKDIDSHVASNSCQKALPTSQANKCPLCLANIPPGENGWKVHLLRYPGCKSNPRAVLQ